MFRAQSASNSRVQTAKKRERRGKKRKEEGEEEERKRRKKERKEERKSGNKRNVAVCRWTGETQRDTGNAGNRTRRPRVDKG